MSRRSAPLKISLALDITEIMSVIESLPEGHILLPYLAGKRDTLMAGHRIQQRVRKHNEAY